MSSRTRVLVVEDEFLIALALSQQLRNLGYEVVGIARDGDEGVQQAVHLSPDVVLMDIGLPGVDGIEALKRVAAESAVPVVMLSAYDDERRLGEAHAAGAAGYLLKPATQRQLRDALERVLGPAAPNENDAS